MTAYVYQEIYKRNGAAGTSVTTPSGTATLDEPAPPTQWLELARKIAYDDSVAYDIETFGDTSPGHRNSSFSPEDLCSNYLGTVAAASALNPYLLQRKFIDRMDHVVRLLVTELGVQPMAEARKAFDRKNGTWVSWSGITSVNSSTYLRRRNFTRAFRG